MCLGSTQRGRVELHSLCCLLMSLSTHVSLSLSLPYPLSPSSSLGMVVPQPEGAVPVTRCKPESLWDLLLQRPAPDGHWHSSSPARLRPGWRGVLLQIWGFPLHQVFPAVPKGCPGPFLLFYHLHTSLSFVYTAISTLAFPSGTDRTPWLNLILFLKHNFID